MSLFNPVRGLMGGGLIGLSAAVLLLGAGEILGASGLASSLVLHHCKTLANPANQWKVVFIATFLFVSKAIASIENTSSTFDPQLTVDPNLPVVSAFGHVVAGFLVGLGTKLGNGCTTGHGICGMARLSKRSIINVMSFMTTGIISASLCGSGCPMAKYLRASQDYFPNLLPTKTSEAVAAVVTASVACMAVAVMLRPAPKVDSAETTLLQPDSNGADKKNEEDEQINSRRKCIPAFLSGALFSAGLAISGMIKPSKIYGFLDMSGIRRGSWDPTLLCVMGGGMVVSMLSYQFVKGYSLCERWREPLSCPLALKSSCGRFEVPTNQKIDLELVLGGALFGLGWGIGGFCPGPAMWLAAPGFPLILYCWWPSFFVGSFLAEKIKELKAKTSS